MSDQSTQTYNDEAPYDPQIAPYVDPDSREVTQIGPDGKRHPVSELSGEERSASKKVEEGDAKKGEATPDAPGATSDSGSGDKPSEAPKAAASKGQSADGGDSSSSGGK